MTLRIRCWLQKDNYREESGRLTVGDGESCDTRAS
jgi:hypothetical protein